MIIRLGKIEQKILTHTGTSEMIFCSASSAFSASSSSSSSLTSYFASSDSFVSCSPWPPFSFFLSYLRMLNHFWKVYTAIKKC